MTTSHPCHTFSFEDRPPPYWRARKWQKKALIYLTFRLICFFHGHVSFEHPLSSKNFKNIPRYWNEIILLIRLNCNCSIENPFVLRIILQRKWQYKQTLTEVVGDKKVFNKVLCGDSPTRGPTPYPFIYHIWQNWEYLFGILFHKK